MRKILACTLFLSILLGCATATAQSRKERRAKRKAKIEKQASKSTHTPVSVEPEKTTAEKTEVRTTEPYCPELNRNLTPARSTRSWLSGEKSRPCNPTIRFSTTISISTVSLPRVTRPPIRSMPTACGHSYHRCNSPSIRSSKTTSAVTSIPATERSTGY